jgi:hypothetical protein
MPWPMSAARIPTRFGAAAFDTRASHVEPDAEGYLWADMGPVGGTVLRPYGSRSEALQAERERLDDMVA